MALAITYKGKIASTTAATSYTATTSWTPAANSLLVAFVVTCLGSSPIDPTSVTGHGQTYAKVTGFSAYTLSTTHLLSIWVAKAGGSPSNSAASASYGAVNQTGGVVIEYEITGADLAGTAAQAILQTVTTNGTATSHTSTNLLAAAGSTDNRSMAFCVHLANEATTPAGGNWTETAGADGNFNTPATGAEVQHTASTFDRSPAASWTTSSAYRVFAIEVKNDQAVNVTLAGLEATTAQSSPGSAHTNALAGLGASVERGDPYAYEVDVSWAELQLPAASGGDVTANPTGQAATAAQGALGVSHTQALAGQEAATAQGGIVSAHAQPLAGQAATTERGDLTVTPRSKALTGLEATAAGGLPIAAHSQQLAGQEVAVAGGSPAVARSGAMSGQAATTEQGGLGVLHSQPLAGLQATVEQGALTATVTTGTSVALTGLEAATAQGTLGVLHTQALTGQEATGQAGSATASHAQPLTGQELASAAGALGVNISVPLTEQAASIAKGTLTPATANDVIVQLGGLAATVEQGSLGVDRDHPLLGMEAVVEAGTIVVGQPVLPGGAQPSGGWLLQPRRDPYDVLKDKIEAERRSLDISEKASAVIARVAERQARRAELEGELSRTQEMERALRKANIRWQDSFDRAIAAYRDYYQTAQIASLLELQGVYAEQDRIEAERVAFESDYHNRAITLLLLME